MKREGKRLIHYELVFAFVFSEEEEDGAPSKTETEGCFLARPGRGSDSGKITIEMMTETKLAV